MAEKGFKQLKIDTQFKNLIRPLRHEEYRQLEANLTLDGCRDPIITWHGTIVDGHNRYAICNEHHIPYATQEINFDSREDAIAWICSNQLGRRNITEESRKYLIGRQYEAEKAIGCRKNASIRNQYSPPVDAAWAAEREERETSRRTARRIGQEQHISPTTIQKYSRYSQAVDTLSKIVPELMPLILSGTYKISHENLIMLSQKSAEEVRDFCEKAGNRRTPFVRYSESRQDITGESSPAKPPVLTESTPKIKQMPEFDPDAEVAGLTLTIPSWTSSIDRTKVNANLNLISKPAKLRLETALKALQITVQEMLDTIREAL